MSDAKGLRKVAAIERAATLPMLEKLLEEAVPEEVLTPYSQEAGDRPDLAGYGDIREALGRAYRDVGATEEYKTSVLIGALIRVVATQQERIEALELATMASKA